MNTHVQIDDFGYRDFLLIKAPREQVLSAVTTAVAENASMMEGNFGDFDAEMWKPGLVMRLIMWLFGFNKKVNEAINRTEEMTEEMIAELETNAGPDEPIDLPQMMRFDGDAALVAGQITTRAGRHEMPQMDEFHEDVRLWSIEGSDWVLVEYKQIGTGMSILGFSVSCQLEGVDVLYFRQSGAQALEKHYDFHVHNNGETLRRVLCHATWPYNDPKQEWWEGISDNPLTKYESESLYEGATQETLLDTAKQEAILAGLGLSSRKLREGGDIIDPVLFSRRPGGTPL